jgi:hypothetical protein
MKFERGFNCDTNEIKDSNFTKVEFESFKVRLISGLIIGIILCSIISFLINVLFFENYLEFFLYRYFYLLIILIPIHEAIHIFSFPKPNKAIIGFSLRHFVFYVKYEEDISKPRFLFATLSPLLILSILPIFILPFVKSLVIVSFILLNALASGVDLLTFYLIKKLPQGIILKMMGNDLYYKKKV